MFVVKDNCIKISVRNLVEFMCASGDIDNRKGTSSDVRLMQEGARIHRKIQKSMGAHYHPEVSLKKDFEFNRQQKDRVNYIIRLEGRADGIICDMDENGEGLKKPVSSVIVDEIKTVQNDVSKMTEPVYVHKAQAMCYAYIYASDNSLENISVQLTYCNTETEALNHFKTDYTYEQLKVWFDDLLNGFSKWTDFLFDEKYKRQQSIKNLEFPFEYRNGQRNLVVNVYKTVEAGQNLYIQAPTGVGKTVSTIFPSVAAMGQGYLDKIFYLTSKTITRTVASDTFDILKKHGLEFRTITLTARDKICHLDTRDCNPESCACAKGHFDRINDAVYDMITHESVINREKVEQYSIKHNVCPFELSLDASYWCDGIICDYNYVFDPNVALKRYFAEGNSGEYAFLVDEAHNLVDRARQMFSASLVKEDFLELKKLVKEKDKRLYNSLEKCNRYLLKLKRECDTYIMIDSLGVFPADLERCYSNMQKFMDNHKNTPESVKVMEMFLKVRHFLNMYDCMDEKYRVYAQHDDKGDFVLKLFCIDPSGNISLRLAQARSTIFFSATLLPVNFYKEMLSGRIQDHAIYARSSFPADNKRVIIGRDVSSRYTRRSIAEFKKISRYIYNVIKQKNGNYMVFFPSYAYMKSVFEQFRSLYRCNILNGKEDEEPVLFGYDCIDVILQTPDMNEKEKEDFLNVFERHCGHNDKSMLVGFCVTGGAFSEGIDLKNESLIGAVIVGTGLPMICRERNILREYFDDFGKDGYSYAYVYPGMNKVLQAAGRVIRTDRDKGVIVLLDDRFMTKEYEMLFPREWDLIYPVTGNFVADVVTDFWKK